MNCAECQEQLVPYIEQLLDDAQAEQVAQHVKACPSCQAELKELVTLQECLVSSGKAAAQSDLEEEVMNRIIREQNVRLKSAAQASASLRLRRWIMKNPMTRVAAAATVIVACVMGMMFWQSTESIALADVLAKVEQVQAYFYRATTTVQDQTRGERTAESTVLTSNEYGMRTEATTVNAADSQETRLLTYVLPQQKSVVLVNVTEKQYSHLEMDDATLANMRIENHDPREMLKRLLGCRYEELGTAVIDGVKVQGFETTDPSYLGDSDRKVSARLWVAVETWLPVRYELEMDIRDGVHLSSVQYDYQWGIPVDSSEFEPEIPADFTAHEMDGMQMPSYSEQGTIEALRIAVEFTGRYPMALDLEALQQLMKDIITSDTPASRQLREQLKSAGSPEAAARLNQERLMKIMVLSTFPRMLAAQQADPAYHGDVVTPDDADLPLMRWKAAEGEYRVIFGDRHAETVTADVLAELEAALQQ